MINNNTISEICINNISYDRYLHVSNTIWHTIGLIGIVIGIPGHIFQIILLSNKNNRKDPTLLYFIAIAICELIFLISLYDVFYLEQSENSDRYRRKPFLCIK